MWPCACVSLHRALRCVRLRPAIVSTVTLESLLFRKMRHVTSVLSQGQLCECLCMCVCVLNHFHGSLSRFMAPLPGTQPIVFTSHLCLAVFTRDPCEKCLLQTRRDLLTSRAPPLPSADPCLSVSAECQVQFTCVLSRSTDKQQLT